MSLGADTFKLPFVIVSMNKVKYAISCVDVQHILKFPEFNKVANVPEFVRGVVHLRHKIIPVIDLRVRLGMKSHAVDIENMIELFNAREQDHIRWLNELEASVREKRLFTLARDPTKCAFGKWYYNYCTEDHVIKSLLSSFEEPHRRIHQLADIVCGLTEKGDFQEAYKQIEIARNGDLSSMLMLFDKARKLFREQTREMLVVLVFRGKILAVTVDAVDSVEKIDHQTFEKLSDCTDKQSEFIEGTARCGKDKKMALLLDVEKLFVQHHQH